LRTRSDAARVSIARSLGDNLTKCSSFRIKALTGFVSTAISRLSAGSFNNLCYF
jgi:hypothetical protein